MIKKFSILATLFAFICILPSASIAEEKAAETYKNHLVLKIIGTSEMFLKDIGLDQDAWCFYLDLIDMKSDESVGTATDCLSNVDADFDKNNKRRISLLGTTFFNFLDGSSLITRGIVSVQPTTLPPPPPAVVLTVEDDRFPAGSQAMTHITGSAREGNTIIGGTGKYENITGNVRLSGMVNMDQFFGEEGEPITFSCIFEAYLDDYR